MSKKKTAKATKNEAKSVLKDIQNTGSKQDVTVQVQDDKQEAKQAIEKAVKGFHTSTEIARNIVTIIKAHDNIAKYLEYFQEQYHSFPFYPYAAGEIVEMMERVNMSGMDINTAKEALHLEC